MNVKVFETHAELACVAARYAADELQRSIRTRGRAVIIAATGSSQIKFLEALTAIAGIQWSKITLFHLDNYVGLPESHQGSFHRYLNERLADKVKTGAVHFIDGNAEDLEKECDRYGRLISADEVDVCFAGIGESGHLAFNDPPADFKTQRPYIVVEVSEVSRRQLSGEGWFPSPSDVPSRGITISINQILKARCIISVVPEKRKATAVKNCLENKISRHYPASILRTHGNCHMFLDKDSASRLKRFATGEHKLPVSFEI